MLFRKFKIAFTGLVAIALIVFARRELHRLHVVPDLANSTPKEQSGFILSKIDKPKYGQSQMVIIATQLPQQSSEDFDRRYTPADAFTVSAHDSTGKVWPLSWNVHSYGKYPLDEGHSELSDRKLLFVSLPAAYPPEFQWVDVEVKDKWKRRAKWRLTNLPQAQETTKAPAKVFDTYAENGVFIHAKAVWDYTKIVPTRDRQISFRVLQEATPSSSRRWETEMLGMQPQWIGRDERVLNGSEPAISGSAWTKDIVEKPGAKVSDVLDSRTCHEGYVTTFTAFDSNTNRYGHVAIRLNEYATDGSNALLSSKPIIFTVPIADIGPFEERYPSAFKSKPARH